MARPLLFLRSQRGLSLLELLITVLVSSVILGVALSLIVTQRRQYLNQQATTDVNQTIQSAMDLMGADVRQTGSSIGPGLGLPVIQVIDGGGTNPDTLVLQRKLLAKELTVCGPVTATTIRVTDRPAPTTTCTFTDGNANAMPDTIEEWRDYRCQIGSTKPNCVSPPGNCQQLTPTSANDECSWAYIYNPTNGQGEFFLYQGEAQEGAPADERFQILKSAATPIINAYPVGSRLFILEQRRYSLEAPNARGDRILRLDLVDNQTNTVFNNAPLQIVNRLRGMQIQGIVGGATVDTFNATFPYTNWQTLQAVRINFSVENIGPDARPVIQTLASQFFPRNSLSR